MSLAIVFVSSCFVSCPKSEHHDWEILDPSQRGRPGFPTKMTSWTPVGASDSGSCPLSLPTDSSQSANFQPQ